MRLQSAWKVNWYKRLSQALGNELVEYKMGWKGVDARRRSSKNWWGEDLVPIGDTMECNALGCEWQELWKQEYL